MLDPCGMEMGQLRTCYSVDVRFAPGLDPVRVRWYWCSPRAKVFPEIHAGLSRDWFTYRADLGEVPGTKRYDKGKNVHNKRGQCHRGEAEWYRLPFDPTALAGQIVVDKCTSCPGRGPRVGCSARGTRRDRMWADPAFEPFAPWMLVMTVAGSFGGVADGVYEFEYFLYDNQGWYWRGDIGGTVYTLRYGITTTALIYRVDEPATGLLWGQDSVVNPSNPWTWASTGALFSPFDGATLTINAAPVRPAYYHASRVAVLFRPGWRPSQAGWIVSPGSTASDLPPGPSGFDDGYDDGYGG